MPLTTADLIDRIGDHLAATLPTTPDSVRWTRSRFLPPMLGQDSEAKLSRCWSVWSPSQTKQSPISRQVIAEGSQVETAIEVGFTHTLRQDNAAADYTAALNAEAALIYATMSVSRVSLPMFLLGSTNRSMENDGRTLVTTLTFRAAHTIPLTA
jgi:hypothetical protein